MKYHGGTVYEMNLVEQAKEYWEQGKQLPIHLFARLAEVGLDVEKLEQLNLKES